MQVVGLIVAVIALLVALGCCIARFRGTHRTPPYPNAFDMNLMHELGLCGAFGSVGAAVAFHPAFAAGIVPSFLIGIFGDRRRDADRQQRRQRNRLELGNVLERDAPAGLELHSHESVALYDLTEYALLGVASASDVQVLLKHVSQFQEYQPNDVSVMLEEFDNCDSCGPGSQLRKILEPHLEMYGTAVIRWIPTDRCHSAEPRDATESSS